MRWYFILAGALIIFISSLLSYSASAYGPMPIDDLYIVFIYAKHLVHNQAIYYNEIGDYTDGFTSLLDVLLKACLYLINPNRLLTNTIFINQLITFLIPTCFWIFLIKFCKSWDARCALLAFCILITFGGIMQPLAWITVETPLFILLGLLFCLAFAASEKTLFGKLLPLILGMLWVLSRPEAIFIILFAQILFWLINRRHHISLLPLSIFVCLYLSSRIYIFGYWAPNTYYAKRSGSSYHEIQDGFSFVTGHLLNPEITAGLALALIIFILAYRSKVIEPLMRFRILLLSGVSIFGIFLLVLSGGDTYYWTIKFLIPYVLFGYFATGAFLITSGYRMLFALLMCIAALTFSVSLNKQENILSTSAYLEGIDKRVAIIRLQEKCDTNVALKLEQHFPGKKIGQSDFQKIKYVNDKLDVTDLSGLNDKEIAHMSFNDRNIFGKFKLENVLQRDIDIYFISYGFRNRRSVNGANPAIALSSRENLEKYMSFPYEQSPDIFIERMTLGSIKSCGWYYNFLIKKSIVPGLVFLDEQDTSENAP